MEVAKTLSLTRLQAGPSESSSHLALPPQPLKSWTNTDIVSNSSKLPSLICLLEKTHGWQRICCLSQPAPETGLLSPPPASRRARWKHLCVAGQPPLPAFCNFPLPWFFGAPGCPIPTSFLCLKMPVTCPQTTVEFSSLNLSYCRSYCPLRSAVITLPCRRLWCLQEHHSFQPSVFPSWTWKF